MDVQVGLVIIFLGGLFYRNNDIRLILLFLRRLFFNRLLCGFILGLSDLGRAIGIHLAGFILIGIRIRLGCLISILFVSSCLRSTRMT